MKRRSRESIGKKIQEIWPLFVHEVKLKNGSVKVTIEGLGETPECSIAQLDALSEFFGARYIHSRLKTGWSSTCDRGVYYKFILRVE